MSPRLPNTPARPNTPDFSLDQERGSTRQYFEAPEIAEAAREDPGFREALLRDMAADPVLGEKLRGGDPQVVGLFSLLQRVSPVALGALLAGCSSPNSFLAQGGNTGGEGFGDLIQGLVIGTGGFALVTLIRRFLWPRLSGRRRRQRGDEVLGGADAHQEESDAESDNENGFFSMYTLRTLGTRGALRTLLGTVFTGPVTWGTVGLLSGAAAGLYVVGGGVPAALVFGGGGAVIGAVGGVIRGGYKNLRQSRRRGQERIAGERRREERADARLAERLLSANWSDVVEFWQSPAIAEAMRMLHPQLEIPDFSRPAVVDASQYESLIGRLPDGELREYILQQLRPSAASRLCFRGAATDLQRALQGLQGLQINSESQQIILELITLAQEGASDLFPQDLENLIERLPINLRQTITRFFDITTTIYIAPVNWSTVADYAQSQGLTQELGQSTSVIQRIVSVSQQGILQDYIARNTASGRMSMQEVAEILQESREYARKFARFAQKVPPEHRNTLLASDPAKALIFESMKPEERRAILGEDYIIEAVPAADFVTRCPDARVLEAFQKDAVWREGYLETHLPEQIRELATHPERVRELLPAEVRTFLGEPSCRNRVVHALKDDPQEMALAAGIDYHPELSSDDFAAVATDNHLRTAFEDASLRSRFFEKVKPPLLTRYQDWKDNPTLLPQLLPDQVGEILQLDREVREFLWEQWKDDLPKLAKIIDFPDYKPIPKIPFPTFRKYCEQHSPESILSETFPIDSQSRNGLFERLKLDPPQLELEVMLPQETRQLLGNDSEVRNLVAGNLKKKPKTLANFVGEEFQPPITEQEFQECDAETIITAFREHHLLRSEELAATLPLPGNDWHHRYPDYATRYLHNQTHLPQIRDFLMNKMKDIAVDAQVLHEQILENPLSFFDEAVTDEFFLSIPIPRGLQDHVLEEYISDPERRTFLFNQLTPQQRSDVIGRPYTADPREIERLCGKVQELPAETILEFINDSENAALKSTCLEQIRGHSTIQQQLATWWNIDESSVQEKVTQAMQSPRALEYWHGQLNDKQRADIVGQEYTPPETLHTALLNASPEFGKYIGAYLESHTPLRDKCIQAVVVKHPDITAQMETWWDIPALRRDADMVCLKDQRVEALQFWYEALETPEKRATAVGRPYTSPDAVRKQLLTYDEPHRVAVISYLEAHQNLLQTVLAEAIQRDPVISKKLQHWWDIPDLKRTAQGTLTTPEAKQAYFARLTPVTRAEALGLKLVTHEELVEIFRKNFSSDRAVQYITQRPELEAEILKSEVVQSMLAELFLKTIQAAAAAIDDDEDEVINERKMGTLKTVRNILSGTDVAVGTLGSVIPGAGLINAILKGGDFILDRQIEDGRAASKSKTKKRNKITPRRINL